MRVGLGIRPVAGWVGLNIRPHQMAVNMELREKLMEKNNRKQTACDEYEQSNEVKKSRLSLRVAMVTDDEDSSSMLESSGDTCSDPECPECMADCSEEDFEMKSKLPVKKKIFSRSSLTGFPHLALKKFLLGMNSSEDSGYGYSHTDLPFGYTGKKENTDAFKSSPVKS